MAELSNREQQVLELIALGHENLHAAKRLGISVDTVKTHVKGVLTKLDALNRAHAVAIAYESGILQPVYLHHPAIDVALDTMRKGNTAA